MNRWDGARRLFLMSVGITDDRGACTMTRLPACLCLVGMLAASACSVAADPVKAFAAAGAECLPVSREACRCCTYFERGAGDAVSTSFEPTSPEPPCGSLHLL